MNDDAIPLARGHMLTHALKSTRFLVLLGLVIAFLVPSITRDPYVIGVGVSICIWAVVAQSWNLVMGVAGIWWFAQLAILAIGGYTNVILLTRLHVPPPIAFGGGGLGGLIAGMVVGLLCTRLRGIYVVLFTLAFAESLRILISTDNSGFSGGTFGLSGFDALGTGREGALAGASRYYYLALCFAICCSLLLHQILRSPVGLAFRALRESEPYATGRGVNRARYQLIVFAVAAALTGLSGSLYADYFNSISPAVLDFDQITLLLAMLVIGGWGTFWGPIVGVIIVTVVAEKLQDIDNWRLFVFAAWMTMMIVLLPSGVVGLAGGASARFKRGLARLARWLE